MNLSVIDSFKDMDIVQQIARGYQESFGGDPWHEGFRCPVCAITLALADEAVCCPRCASHGRSVLLVEYWPLSKIITDFYTEMCKAGAICVIAQSENHVIGFAWGYGLLLTEEKAVELEAPALSKLLSGEFFYLDECAVVPSAQGRGIGSRMILYLQNLLPMGIGARMLLRTKENSWMYRLIAKRGGTIVCRISRDRVMMLV
jgi:GNAT superfamily N-acetyltransferase